MQDKWVFAFHIKLFQVPLPSYCWAMVEYANIFNFSLRINSVQGVSLLPSMRVFHLLTPPPLSQQHGRDSWPSVRVAHWLSHPTRGYQAACWQVHRLVLTHWSWNNMDNNLRTANMSCRTCVVIKQMQSNPWSNCWLGHIVWGNGLVPHRWQALV